MAIEQTTRYKVFKKYQSYDNGVTWVLVKPDETEYMAWEHNSIDCGYTPPSKSDITGSTLPDTVDLNNQWVVSTKKIDGYLVLMSNSNKGNGPSYASMKIKFKGKPDFKIWINSYAEYEDYTIALDMDVDYPTVRPSSGKLTTEGFQKDPSRGIDSFKEVDYPNDGGEHFVVVTYTKDSRINKNDDRGYVAIKLKVLSTTWVVSSTEFIKENYKYYQRINEVGTYEGGSTGLTGNFKAGDELTPSYIQSSDDNDYILVENSKYYKKYTYVTPVDTAINTGDYIQGDYIGEYKPTIITYDDGTTREYSIKGEITRSSIDRISQAISVRMTNWVSSIGDSTFSGFSKLNVLSMPESILSIGSKSFEGCHSLTSVSIPSGVKDIGSQAFYYCYSLKEINIPSGVTIIKDSLFENCYSLKEINIPSGVTSISSRSFYGCSGLTSVSIPSGVKDIGSQAFESCYSLKEINISSGLTRIAEKTFKGCYSLTSVSIPSGVIEIESEAFSDNALSSVILPSSLESIGDYAFYYNALSSVILPSSLKSIGGYVFNNNDNLNSITFLGTTSQWNAITKSKYWHYGVPATVVHCTDGDITL